MAKDMLFATLDTTTRSIELPDGQTLLLTDTVGFVRNLPHRLVEAFKATLEEAVLSDFLIHVLDVSDPRAIEFFETTMNVLNELGAVGKPMITVLNKVDKIEDHSTLDELKERFPNTLLLSAREGLGVEELRLQCSVMLADRVRSHCYRIPQSRGDLSAILHKEAKVLTTEYEGNDVLITAIVPAIISGRLAQFISEE